MQAGDLRHLIEIIETEHTTNDWGDPVESVKVVYRTYAAMENLKSREFWEAAQVNSENTVRFKMRWHPDIEFLDRMKVRLRWRGRVFDVLSIDNVEYRNELVVIRAKEVAQ